MSQISTPSRQTSSRHLNGHPSSPSAVKGVPRRYIPTKGLGTGTYGQVYLCYDSFASSSQAMPPSSPAQVCLAELTAYSQGGRKSNLAMSNVGIPMYAVKVANKEAAYRRSALNESKVLQLLVANQETVMWIDTYEEDGHICIVTELLTKTVYELMKERSFQPMSLGDARAVVTNVCRSLSALHRHGYIHCDVKPENIMLRCLTEGPRSSCLIDFGAVRALTENAYFDIQSLWYRAPEVLCCVPYTPKIDAWSMGCLLYELATGTPLFAGMNAADELTRIVDVMGSPSAQACANVQTVALRYCPGPTRKAQKVIDDKVYQIHGRNPASEALVNLLYSLLNPDESARMSCEDALAHPFLASSNKAQYRCVPSQQQQQQQAMPAQCHISPSSSVSGSMGFTPSSPTIAQRILGARGVGSLNNAGEFDASANSSSGVTLMATDSISTAASAATPNFANAIRIGHASTSSNTASWGGGGGGALLGGSFNNNTTTSTELPNLPHHHNSSQGMTVVGGSGQSPKQHSRAVPCSPSYACQNNAPTPHSPNACLGPSISPAMLPTPMMPSPQLLPRMGIATHHMNGVGVGCCSTSSACSQSASTSSDSTSSAITSLPRIATHNMNNNNDSVSNNNNNNNNNHNSNSINAVGHQLPLPLVDNTSPHRGQRY